MQTILFPIFFFLTRVLALLPLRVIYAISDTAAFVIYHLIRYRRKVVAQNLLNSFPEKSRQELKRIEVAYYKHFCDLFLELFYIFYADERKAIKLCKFLNPDLLMDFYNQGKSVIVAAGHYSNWEILSLIALQTKHITIGVYKPLEDKRFEKFMNRSRERFGGVPVPMRDSARLAISYNQQGKLFFLGLISDQTPVRADIRYWTTFLNQDTPVFLGVEKIAQKTNQPVLFCNMRKVRRGCYEVEFTVLTEIPKNTQPYEITEMHVRALENLIREAPEYWLWSHKRWKHKKPSVKSIPSLSPIAHD